MIEGLKPYAEYKESGQKWLGEVPKHWDVRRTKLILREVDSRSTTGKEQLLRVSQFTGVTQRKTADGSDTPDTRAASLVGYKRVSVNDLVINIMLAWNGSMGVSRFDGIASPAYCVYRLNKGAQPWYFHQLFRLPLYKGRIKAVSTGVIESRLRLYSDDLGRIEAILPPLDEQAAIVRFLDHANRKIDGFIRAKRKLIGLLNEQKQAIIHRAVTGKDEVRRMKDEQQQIVAFITKETSTLTTAIARTEREIALMQEYRTRLTADLVTGKLDVREAAAKLPEVEPEPAANATLEDLETE